MPCDNLSTININSYIDEVKSGNYLNCLKKVRSVGF